ncbi:MAG: DUF1566 domain-containing protein [Bacteroidetes bacterium]|nr:DUF1566 domain-containing protein [Bacteroidota bacterium]
MFLLISLIILLISNKGISQTPPYPIVDTGVEDSYNNSAIISTPTVGQPFYGQDASYSGNQPSYTDNGDGTITDNVTGLMWEQDMGSKITFDDAFIKAENLELGGYMDWRVPTIKELYSLILFTGRVMGGDAVKLFIDTDYFDQPIGDTSIGEREIDAQTWSSTEYVGLTMMGNATVFGVNFIDGRIKGYPKYKPPLGFNPNKMYFRMVRGNTSYGSNNLVDNDNGTISDNATGLMWQQADDGTTRDWKDALSYAENLSLGGHSDWRLPNAKELQSIVDYTRCPDVTNSAAIDPLFSATTFNDPGGNPGQYGHYWTGTSHMDGPNPFSAAVYVAFGEAQGKMNGTLLDVHGAGAQRSDPKTGAPSAYPQYFGPQGDVRYVFNYVRCVRDISETTSIDELDNHNFNLKIYPNPAQDTLKISSDYEIKTINIYNVAGEKVFEKSVHQKEVHLSTSQLLEGIYFVQVLTKEGLSTSGIVILGK